MLAQITKDMNTNIFIHAANRLKLEVDLISVGYRYCSISDGRKKLYVYHNWTSLTDIVGRRVTHNKFLCQRIFKRNGIPVPRNKRFDPSEREEIIRYAKDNIPVVVKPIKGSMSRGVTVDPRTDEEIAAAVDQLGSRPLMVEAFVRGDPHRILLYDKQVVDVVRWSPPYVVGDGVHSIEQLVAAKNKYFEANKLTLTVVDSSLLEEKGVGLADVPAPGEQVLLRRKFHDLLGGEPVRMDVGKIHPDNLALFVKAAEVSGLLLAGLDFISEDLSVSYRDNGAAVNEINSAPHMWPHFFAEQKEDSSAIEAVLRRYFGMGAA